MQFQWKAVGPGAPDLSLKDSSKLELRPGMLRGGSAYNFTVFALSEVDLSSSAEAAVGLSVASLGVLASLPAQALTFSKNKDIRLDGRLAKDLDYFTGVLDVRLLLFLSSLCTLEHYSRFLSFQFQWICTQPDGSPCYVTSAYGNAQRRKRETPGRLLRDVLGGELNRDRPIIPAGMLEAGT